MPRFLVILFGVALLMTPGVAADPNGSTGATQGDCANIDVASDPPVEVYPSNCRLPGRTTDELP